MADIFPGAHVVEAGVGSGALSMSLLRAVGDTGRLSSYERRQDFADIARVNVERFFGGPHPAWTLTVGDLVESLTETDVDRVVLDMLAPWETLDAVAKALRPGGLVCCYVATTTQLSTTVEALRAHGCFTEPQSWESIVRGWHVEGLAVRPQHRMVGHTGFLCTSRRLADGVEPPLRRRRPSKGMDAAASPGSDRTRSRRAPSPLPRQVTVTHTPQHVKAVTRLSGCHTLSDACCAGRIRRVAHHDAARVGG